MITALLMPLISIAAALACAFILYRAEPALNRMGRDTRTSVRIAMHLLVVGASGELLCIVLGTPPDWPTMLLLIGIAALLGCARRLRVLIPPPRRRRSSVIHL